MMKNKIVLSKSIQEKMLEFFKQTSIPKMLNN